MKPARFDYVRAETLAEAHAALAAEGGNDARVIAGGQTLVPMLSMRLARPKVVIDIMRSAGLRKIDGGRERDPHRRRRAPGRIAGLAGARAKPSRCWRRRCPGSGTRRRAAAAPSAARWRTPTRARKFRSSSSRSTATIELSVAPQARSVAAAEFFTGMMSTARDGRIDRSRSSMPANAAEHGFAFREFGRRHGDFAIVACAAVAEPRRRSACGRRRRRPADRPRLSRARRQRARRRARRLRLGARRARRSARHRALPPRPGAPHGPRHDRGGPPMPRLSADAAPPHSLHAQRPRRRGRGRAAHVADRFPAPRRSA